MSNNYVNLQLKVELMFRQVPMAQEQSPFWSCYCPEVLVLPQGSTQWVGVSCEGTPYRPLQRRNWPPPGIGKHMLAVLP